MEDLNLYDVLKQSYNHDNDPNSFSENGFNYDPDISDHNNQIYYNKDKNKLLHTISGTKSLKDIGTDLYLGLGLLKSTDRYKQSDDILKKAREKYKPDKVSVVGSSLGGAIASKIGKRNDNIITYNKPSLFNEKIIKNERSYRKSGDLISIFNNKLNTKTIPNNTYTLPYLPTLRGVTKEAYENHKLKHLKNQNIYV